MTTPKQLPLEFVAPSLPAAPEGTLSATVVSLHTARTAKSNREMKLVYQQIVDSVQHIRVPPRAVADGDEATSIG